MAKDISDISRFIENIEFKKKIFGGIDEIEVWKIIEKLNSEYKELYEIQEIKLRTLESLLNEK